MQAVKYLYKYVYKGHDKAIVELMEKFKDQPQRLNQILNDEVKRYLYSRYVSDCEAFWRIFGYSLHEEFPNVYRLAVHLEDEQEIVWNEQRDTVSSLCNNERHTTLTKWFSYNRYFSLIILLIYLLVFYTMYFIN